MEQEVSNGVVIITTKEENIRRKDNSNLEPEFVGKKSWTNWIDGHLSFFFYSYERAKDTGNGQDYCWYLNHISRAE